MQEAIRTAKDPKVVRGVVRRWTKESDLAGVRNADRIESLEDDERAAYVSFWAEVGRTIGE